MVSFQTICDEAREISERYCSTCKEGMMETRVKFPKILIVDDDPEVNDLLSRFLTTLGYDDIETALDGKEGIEIAEIEMPDLVLLDLILPDIKGDIVFQKIKEVNKDTSVIAITGHPDTEVAYRIKREKVSGFVTKPFDLKYLEATIFSALV